MKYCHFLPLALLFFLARVAVSPASGSGITSEAELSFTLPAAARTSAGVFDQDVLVRTLWSNQERPAGVHSLKYAWDGKDDAGNFVADKDYTIKVMAANVTYEWLKPVGTTSVNTAGPAVIHYHQMFTGMVQVGNDMYGAVGYQETSDVHVKFAIGAPNICTTSLTGGGQTIRFLATDGNIVYSGGQRDGPTTFITGIIPHPGGTDSLAMFSSGVPYSMPSGSSFEYSAFNVTGNADYISGLAVMKAGNYLFASHSTLNQLRVFDKTTGAPVQTIAASKARDLAISGNHLWMISGTSSVTKHIINSDGSIGAALLTLSGLTDPLCLAVSPDGLRVAVSDRGLNHQVKFYSTTNGALVNTLGRADNYSNPAVYNDKFYFNNTRIFQEGDFGASHAFLAFQSDGSIWIGDYGNMRCQHFDANLAYIDNIQYMGYSYSCQVDPANPARVFSDFLEFQVDYSDNSWAFVRNWSKNLTLPTSFDADRMRSVITLSNGRTYALYSGGGSGREVIELVPATGVRRTGVYLESSSDLYADGSVWQIGPNAVGQPTFWKRRPLTGFDASNNPLWGPSVTLETTPAITVDDPVTADGYLRRSQVTSTGIIASFSSDNSNHGRATGYHLGGFKNGKWLFRTSHATFRDYQGEFPKDGAYDIGNGVNNPGSFMQVVERHIFWGYIGEFWKGSQTNKYNHYYDNGLMLGQFGVSGDIARESGLDPFPGMAGNALSGTYVKVGDDIHFFHCDEGHQAAVHHWKISNLGSIQEFSIPVAKSGNPVLPALGLDLMEGVPMVGPVANNTGRWSFSPATYDLGYADKWVLMGGVTTYRREDRSIRFESRPTQTAQTQEAFCNLGSNNSGPWRIEGKLSYPEQGEPEENFLEVLDANGKVIVRISRPQFYPALAIKANGTTIVMADLSILGPVINKLKPLSIRSDGANVFVKYADYNEVMVSALDPAASAGNPAKLKVHFFSADTRGHVVDLANLRFFSSTVPTVLTTAASGLGSGAATLNGTFDPHGVPTNAFFQWGATAGLTKSTALGSPASGNGMVSFSAPLTGLLPSASYYYRIAATNVNDPAPVVGEILRFTTGGTSALETWKQSELGDANAPDLGDRDVDGLSNLAEYALLYSPSVPNGGPVISLAGYPEGTRLRMMVMRDSARNNITIEVQAAGSLTGPWTTVAASVHGGPFSGSGYVTGDSDLPGVRTVEIRDIVNDSQATRRFMRVLVTH